MASTLEVSGGIIAVPLTPFILFLIAALLFLAVLLVITSWITAHIIALGRAIKAAGYNVLRWPGEPQPNFDITRNDGNRFGVIAVAGLVIELIGLAVICNEYQWTTTREHAYLHLWTGLLVIWILLACANLGSVVYLAKKIKWRDMSSGEALKGIRLGSIDKGDGRAAERAGLM